MGLLKKDTTAKYMHLRATEAFRRAIREIAEENGLTVAQLVRNAINAKYPQVQMLTKKYAKEMQDANEPQN